MRKFFLLVVFYSIAVRG